MTRRDWFMGFALAGFIAADQHAEESAQNVISKAMEIGKMLDMVLSQDETLASEAKQDYELTKTTCT